MLKIVFIIVLSLQKLVYSEICNELVCGSIVSKCLILQSCQCKLQDCVCCKDCLNCLGDLYTECCNCLDICPTHNETFSLFAPKSQIGDFDGIPELFTTLTSELYNLGDDNENYKQWTTFSFPLNIADLEPNIDEIELLNILQTRNSYSSPNCTVIYLNNCLSNLKCGEYCESMGASSYRWFFDGCCECAGYGCLNYGINESRCAKCPDLENNNDEDENDDDELIDYNNNDELWDYEEDLELSYR